MLTTTSWDTNVFNKNLLLGQKLGTFKRSQKVTNIGWTDFMLFTWQVQYALTDIYSLTAVVWLDV